MQWYYRHENQQQGPVSWDQMLAAARKSEFGPHDPVWCAGMPDWQMAIAVPGLFPDVPQFPSMPPGFASFPPPLPPPDVGEDLGMRMLLPVGRSGWAIASGYLGLCSFFPILGPFAIFTGIMAIRAMRRDPKLHGMGRAVFGIVMGILGTLLLLAIIVAMIHG